MQNFYILLAFLLITIALLIAVSIYCYLLKYRVTQNHLLSFHFTNKKLQSKSEMSNKVKNIDIKNRRYYFFNDIINIKNFDPNNIKIDEKPYKNILVYYIGYVMVKDLKYLKINSENPLYLIFSNVNGYFEEIERNKYLMLVPPNASKEKIKKYEELWIKFRGLIRSITKTSHDYNERYTNIKFNSDDRLPLNKMIEITSMIIVVRALSHENNKYYPLF